MLSISAVSKAEKNKLSTGSAFLILLEIQLPSVVRLVYNNEDITWNGYTWQSFPMKLSEASEESNGSDPNLSVQVDNVAQGMTYYVEEAGGAVDTPVILRVVNSENLPNGEADLEEYYVVTECKVNEQWVTFTLGNEYSARTRRPLYRYMKNNCPFAYKGLRCGYAGGAAACNHTLQDCRNRGNSHRFGGFPGIDQKGVYANV